MRLFSAALFTFGLAGFLGSTTSSAQTIEWRKSPDGASSLTINAPNWNPVYSPDGKSAVVMSSVGTPSPAGGQRMRALVTSNFLLNAPPAGFHFAFALNYAPIYSYADWYWTSGVMGNQGSLVTLGDAQNSFQDGPCPRGARFEAVYQVPNYSHYYYWYPFGVAAGANGMPNALAGCLPLLYAETSPGSGEYQMHLEFDSQYSGIARMATSPSYGSPILAVGYKDWSSWFNSTTLSGMIRHSGIGIAPIGELPAGSFIRVQFLEMTGY